MHGRALRLKLRKAMKGKRMKVWSHKGAELIQTFCEVRAFSRVKLAPEDSAAQRLKEVR